MQKQLRLLQLLANVLLHTITNTTEITHSSIPWNSVL